MELTQEELAVVKLAAAQRYRELGIHPNTAAHIFDRHIEKSAKCSKSHDKAKGKADKAKKSNKAEKMAAGFEAMGKAYKKYKAPAGVEAKLDTLKKPAAPKAPAAPVAKEASVDTKITKLAENLKSVLKDEAASK